MYIIRMTSREVIRRLRRDGWVLRNVTGSHQHFVHSTKPGVVTVPFTNKDIDRHAAEHLPAGRMGLEDTAMRYAVVIHKDPGSSYGVTVPDLPGCFSGGETLDEAFDNARDGILGHIETLLMDGQPIPEGAPIEEHQANEDYRDGMWGFVDVDLAKVDRRAKRVDITLPGPVLAAVDEAAARSHDTRSGFLARAALAYIEMTTAGALRR